jgi:hypothetical protein
VVVAILLVVNRRLEPPVEGPTAQVMAGSSLAEYSIRMSSSRPTGLLQRMMCVSTTRRLSTSSLTKLSESKAAAGLVLAIAAILTEERSSNKEPSETSPTSSR